MIRYKENIDDGKVNVRIKIEEEGVKLMGKGEINMKFDFVEGGERRSVQDIGGGGIGLNVKRLSIVDFVRGDGGKVKVDQELYENEEKMGKTTY